jgi:hypothetical protein
LTFVLLLQNAIATDLFEGAFRQFDLAGCFVNDKDDWKRRFAATAKHPKFVCFTTACGPFWRGLDG